MSLQNETPAERRTRQRGWLTPAQFAPLRQALREKAGREPEPAPPDHTAAAEDLGQQKLDLGEEDAT